MGVVRMEIKRKTFLKIFGKSGQSTVEYILLLAVVSSMGFTVYNSRFFKQMFGENSSVFDALRKRMEYDYRYTQDGAEDTLGTDYNGQHESYFAQGGAESHYFFPQNEY